MNSYSNKKLCSVLVQLGREQESNYSQEKVLMSIVGRAGFERYDGNVQKKTTEKNSFKHLGLRVFREVNLKKLKGFTHTAKPC